MFTIVHVRGRSVVAGSMSSLPFGAFTATFVASFLLAIAIDVTKLLARGAHVKAINWIRRALAVRVGFALAEIEETARLRTGGGFGLAFRCGFDLKWLRTVPVLELPASLDVQSVEVDAID